MLLLCTSPAVHHHHSCHMKHMKWLSITPSHRFTAAWTLIPARMASPTGAFFSGRLVYNVCAESTATLYRIISCVCIHIRRHGMTGPPELR